MFVNKILFLISLGKNVKFTTIKNVVDRKAVTLIKDLRSIKNLCTNKIYLSRHCSWIISLKYYGPHYKRRAWHSTPHSQKSTSPKLNNRSKLLSNETGARGTHSLLKTFPNQMICWMVENTVFWINALPINSRMSSTISPETLMTGTMIDFAKHCKIECGAYAKSHKNTFPWNSLQPWTEPAICIRPTGNFQGSYWFLNLRIGRHIKRRKFIPLPVPALAIDSVYELAKAKKPELCSRFLWPHGQPIEVVNTSNEDNDTNAQSLAGVENKNNNGIYYHKEEENTIDSEKNEDTEIHKKMIYMTPTHQEWKSQKGKPRGNSNSEIQRSGISRNLNPRIESRHQNSSSG